MSRIMHDEIIKQIQMTYDEQCAYLQQKYGLPKRGYFANESCKSKVKTNSRTAEGLFIHHNMEVYHVGNLADPSVAKKYPFEYQKRENLSYCNYLEHLILHLKINAHRCIPYEWPIGLKNFFYAWGFFLICNEMNGLYYNSGSEVEWRNHCYAVIREYYDEYVSILKGTLCFLDDLYTGPRNIRIEEGTKLGGYILRFSEQRDNSETKKYSYYEKYDFVITEVNPLEDIVVIRFDNGEERVAKLTTMQKQSDIEYQKMIFIRRVVGFITGGLWEELEQRLKEEYTEEEKLIARSLKMEFAEK